MYERQIPGHPHPRSACIPKYTALPWLFLKGDIPVLFEGPGQLPPARGCIRGESFPPKFLIVALPGYWTFRVFRWDLYRHNGGISEVYLSGENFTRVWKFFAMSFPALPGKRQELLHDSGEHHRTACPSSPEIPGNIRAGSNKSQSADTVWPLTKQTLKRTRQPRKGMVEEKPQSPLS